MSKEELISDLNELQRSIDPEKAHIEADSALLKYINDPEVEEAFYAIDRWYA